jgi:hypothetical protein
VVPVSELQEPHLQHAHHPETAPVIKDQVQPA